MIHRVETEVAGKKMILEVGRVGRQADCAVWVQYGDTVVLVTAVASEKIGIWPDQLPLTVDYQEKSYAAGRIPGGFFKREGRPSEKEVLGCRIIDRTIRPLFPKNWFFETQIIASVFSSDQNGASEIMGVIGASTALTLSNIPFYGPVGAVRVGRINGQFVINPTFSEMKTSDLSILVSGSETAVTMIECEARELPEEVVGEAIAFGHNALLATIPFQNELHTLIGQAKRQGAIAQRDEAFVAQWKPEMEQLIQKALLISGKAERKAQFDQIRAEQIEKVRQADPSQDRSKEVSALFSEVEKQTIRRRILDQKVRADGRGIRDIRPITCEVSVLPRAHGSAIFTRGETQSLSVITLGSKDDEQRVESLEGETRKEFMLNYNFPPFSVGEAKGLRSPGRREIGHGALAEKALKPVIPAKEHFPYTLRLVSEILESNGSSSMATVCGGTLALMDAGVTITRPVAGVAMGLVKEGNDVEILSDISGLEDNVGDMDFKVAGTEVGITAIQVDIKIHGLNLTLIKRALDQAKIERLVILGEMKKAIANPRAELSTYAPRIVTVKVRPEKVGGVIGPGGKNVKGIIEKTGVKIDIQDDGTINVSSANSEAVKTAVEMIKAMGEDVEVGRIYTGKVVRIMDFGAFVELKRGVDGLVHISQLAHERVDKVTDVVKEGDVIEVKVLEIDKQGKIRLSRKELLPKD
ncbi:MAG: polyribonucleotide nucleotidyltransferase [Nitrospirae bacterium]|nr:polyribonucleotide nucleotidyltransferase [Candidatus Troglogloeales bacterium]